MPCVLLPFSEFEMFLQPDYKAGRFRGVMPDMLTFPTVRLGETIDIEYEYLPREEPGVAIIRWRPVIDCCDDDSWFVRVANDNSPFAVWWLNRTFEDGDGSNK